MVKTFSPSHSYKRKREGNEKEMMAFRVNEGVKHQRERERERRTKETELVEVLMHGMEKVKQKVKKNLMWNEIDIFIQFQSLTFFSFLSSVNDRN